MLIIKTCHAKFIVSRDNFWLSFTSKAKENGHFIQYLAINLFFLVNY